MDGADRIVYDEWGGGEYGTKNPAKAENGMWTGLNMVVYRNGRIGPRPGLNKIDVGTPGQNGPLAGLGFSPVGQTNNEPIMYIIDDDVYSFDPDVLTLTAVGTLGASVISTNNQQNVLSKESVRLIGDELYFPNDNDSIYRVNLRTQTLTDISTSGTAQQGTDIELYRDRMVVCNGSNRVFYSEPADFDDWPAGNFFDVGAAYRIIHLLEMRDALLIFTQSGLWVMTGNAVDGTLRRVSDTLAPLDKAIVRTNDDVVYIPSSRSAPVIFNGSYGDELALKHLDTWKADSSGAMGVQSYGNRDVIFCDDSDNMLWRKNDAWSYHTFEGSKNIGPWVTRYFDDNVVVADPGSGARPAFYMLAMNLDRPAFTSDSWAQPGDESTTPLDAYFTLPDHLAPEGYELRIRSITVDFVSYATGSATNNNIDVDWTIIGKQFDDSATTTTKAGIFNEAGTDYSTSGVYCRRVYKTGDGPFGAGYRVKLDNIKGVAIDRVIVEIEKQPLPVT